MLKTIKHFVTFLIFSQNLYLKRPTRLSKSIFILILITFATNVLSQSIKISTINKPLNELLVELRDQYDLKFSYNDDLLSKFSVNVDKEFVSFEHAIVSILKGLPLEYQNKNNIYIIFPKLNVQKTVVKEFLISGVVIDALSRERLPFSNLQINSIGLTTDFNGTFSFKSTKDSLFNIRSSYLGYFICDTVMPSHTDVVIRLMPSFVGLKEIVVENQVVERGMQIGHKPGILRLNNIISGILPGNVDNSIFNLLRLQPGILAAGENSSDLIIRGNHQGHSSVLFDGATVYSLKNYKDNISSINPFIAKDISVMKGGFGAEYGERVGGIVNITGHNGDRVKPSVKVNFDNMTINGMFSTPVFKNNVLLLAFRKTYYNLFNIDDVKIFNKSQKNSSESIEVNPDYGYLDVNFKFSGNLNNGDNYFISALNKYDQFEYSASKSLESLQKDVSIEKFEKNRQSVVSAFYGKRWTGGHSTDFKMHYSNLLTDFRDTKQITKKSRSKSILRRDDENVNRVVEKKIMIDHYFPKTKRHEIQAGAGIVYNHVTMLEDSISQNIRDFNEKGSVFNFYLQDNISVTDHLSVTFGLRNDYSHLNSTNYLQPRVSFKFDINESSNINGAWGIYNQFVSKGSTIDDAGNFLYTWSLCDNEDIPVVEAQHILLGYAFDISGFAFSVESYLNRTSGLTRYVKFKKRGIQKIFQGDGRSYGVDIFVRKSIKKHSAWISYSLSKTEERYDYFKYTNKFNDGQYYRALHDQRHELKFASLLNFNPIYLSMNYVFGSGFADPAQFSEYSDGDNLSYSRFDIALIYRLKIKQINVETGVSILNMFNEENVKYSNFDRVPADQINSINIKSKSVSFTPLMFIKFTY